MRVVLVLISVLSLAGCAGNGYKNFYKPFADAKKIPNVQLLGENETPTIYSSNDLSRDSKIARSRLYIPIGVSSFNGEMASQSDVVDHARSIGASLVLVNSKFTETREITTPLFIPNHQTTTYSGTTNGTIKGAYGNTNYNSDTNGSATTYGTTVVPITKYQQRFTQQAVFFVKFIGKKPRFGVQLVDLTPELRTKYQRNTGALVEIVTEETPAFEANILPDDIIIEFNGAAVISPKQFIELLQSFDINGGNCAVKVLRDGGEKSIILQIKPA